MKRLAVLAALLLLASLAYGQSGKGYRDDRGYSGRGYVVGRGVAAPFVDVDLSTLGQDLIAGKAWDPTYGVDFSDADKYYFDTTAADGGDGSLESPYRGLGRELYADDVIQRFNSSGVLQNPGAPVGAGDVCVLLGGNQGKIELGDYYFPDYIAFVAAPGQTVLVDYVNLRSFSYVYLDGLKGNPASTRNSGTWPSYQEHTANDYTDFDAGPYFVWASRDTIGNGDPHHLIVNNMGLGTSSGSTPASWDHEEWNSTAVSGVRVQRVRYAHIQGCYGVGMNYGVFVTQDNETDLTYCNVINNTFSYLNGDGLFIYKARTNYASGNDFSDFYVSNDNHVDMIAVYEDASNNIIEGNKLVVASDQNRNPIMAGYTADGGTEGTGVPGVLMIGGNTNNVVRNNVIHGNEYAMVMLRTFLGSSYNLQVTNNTITCDSQKAWDGSGDSGIIVTEITAGGDTIQAEILNNICSEVAIDPSDTWSTESNNSEYARDFSGAGFSYWVADGPPLDQDVAIVFGSENINMGTSRNSPPDDYAETCRAYGGFADIGAYEYDDGGACDLLLRRMVLLPVASVDHFQDSADADIAAADDLLELGLGKDVPEFSWVSMDSATATTSSWWLAYGGRWEKDNIRTTEYDWNITDSSYPITALYYIDWKKYIPSGATILSAEMHVTVDGTWYVSANDSIAATLMTIPDDNLWYTSKGVTLSADAAPNMGHPTWAHQIAGLNTSGYPAAHGGAWVPSLADRQAFDDWGDVSDWTGFPGGANRLDGEEFAISIKNCVQAAVNGEVNNGIMIMAERGSSVQTAFAYSIMEPRPTTGPHDRVPWFTVTYSTADYQTPFPGGEFAFVFTTDDGKVLANETYADVFDEFNWKYSAFVSKTHFNGVADEPTAASITELHDRGFEVGSHSRHHLSPYGIAQWDLQAGRSGAMWDSLLRDVEPDWMYHLADSLDGDSRIASEYFGKSFATPQNQLDQEAVFALAQHGYNGVRIGEERKASSTGLSDYFREMTFRASISDSMRIMGIPGDMLREQNMMGVPYNLGVDDIVGAKTNTTITEAEVKWNFRRLIRQVVAQKTKVVSLYAHGFKSGGYAEGLDEEELRWMLEVVEDEGGVPMMFTDYVNWKKQFSTACATPPAYAQTDSMDFDASDAVWFKPTAETRLYPYEEE